MVVQQCSFWCRKKSAPSRPQGDDEKSEDSGSDSQLSDTKLSDSQDLSSSQVTKQ